jgi:hypothetical protein
MDRPHLPRNRPLPYGKSMSSGTVISLVIGIVFLALLIVRQLSTRRLRENYRVPLIIAIIGVIAFVDFLKTRTTSDTHIIEAVVGSLVLAAVMGVLRAATVRVWRDGAGQLLIRGTWLTGVLWVVAVAAHLGYDYVIVGGGKNGDAVGNATVLLYLAVSLTIQRLVMLTRAQRLEASGGLSVGAPPAGVL